MTYAIIETGGKQYLVSSGNKIKIEKLPVEGGQEVVFDKVLLISDEKETKIGRPHLTGAKVSGKVLKQGRGKKIRILKYKPKVRYRRRKGHRQYYTEIEIKSIAK